MVAYSLYENDCFAEEWRSQLSLILLLENTLIQVKSYHKLQIDIQLP